MTTEQLGQLIITLICALAAVVVFFGGFSWILDGTDVGKVIDNIARPVLLVLFSVIVLVVSGGLATFAATLLWALILS